MYLISVLDADDELALEFDGKELIEKRSSESSQMHHSCWRWCVPDSYWELEENRAC